MEKGHPHSINDVVYEIFQTWLVEDADATWGKLVQCLKEASLNSLAKEIESHLTGVPASSAPTTTTSPATHQLPTKTPAGHGM